jgi:hypothetical protein
MIETPLVEQQKPKSKLVRNIIIAIVVIIIIAIIGGLVYLKLEYKFEIKPNSNKLNIELCKVNNTISTINGTNNIIRVFSIDEINSIPCNANDTIIKTIELVPGKYTETQLKEHLTNQLNNMQLGTWEVFVYDKVHVIKSTNEGSVMLGNPVYKFKLKSIDSDAYDALGIKDHINKMSVVSKGNLPGTLKSYINFV